MLKKTGLRPTYTNPTTLRSDARNCKEEARGHGLEGPPGRCFPIYRAFPPVPPGACQTRRELGERRLESKSIRAGARAPRSARTRQRGASGAGRRGGTRRRRPRPAGGAVRGPRRLPLRTAQSCSRAMFPSGPALREGPRRRRGGGGGGAALTARRGGSPARSPSPATRLPPRGAGLRSCNPPCPSPAAGSRAARAPRRAPPPAPRRSVPSTAPEPRRAGARDDTRTGRSSCGRGASPSEVAGAGSPGSFKQGARAPRAGRAACAHVPAPRPRPRAPRTLPANRQAGPPAASRPGRAARPRPLGCGRGAAVSTPSAANGRSERPALRESPAHPPPLRGVRGELVRALEASGPGEGLGSSPPAPSPVALARQPISVHLRR